MRRAARGRGGALRAGLEGAAGAGGGTWRGRWTGRGLGAGGASAREAGPGVGVLSGGFTGAGPGPGAFGAPVRLGLGLKGSGRRDGDGGRPTFRCGGSSVGLRGCKRGVGWRGRWAPGLPVGGGCEVRPERPEETTGAGGGARETCGRGAGPEWSLVRKRGSG